MSSNNNNPPPSSLPSISSQPLKLLLPFHTQDDYAQKIVKAKQQYATQPVSRAEPPPSQEDIHKLRQEVWQTLQDRLSKHGISLEGLNQRFFSWLLPKNGASVQDWKAFLKDPLHVDTETLKELFVLEQSTGDSRPDPEKNHMVYIRTFTFPVYALIEVLQELLDDGLTDSKITTLMENVSDLDGDQVVFVRYAGQTTSGSAYSRHYKDLIQRQPTFITRFLQAVLRIAPEVIDAAEVYEMVEATVMDYAYFDIDLANKREQALIALLGDEVSLNIQAGGTWASARPYRPSDKDAIDFNALKTTLMHEMQDKCEPCSDFTIQQVDAYTQLIRGYTINHAETTGSVNFPITEKVRIMLRDQAIPAMLGKYALMVTIGSDLTPDAASDVHNFYGGQVEAGNLCSSIFNQFGNWEIGQYMKITAFTVQLQRQRYLPFVDLFAWTKKSNSDLLSALAILRSYLLVTKPIVLLTFSYTVSSAAVGSFQHPHGIKQSEFGDMVGKLIMSKYDEDPSSQDDDNCVIIIPCYHPGSVGYDSRSTKTYMQIISQVLLLVWLAMDRAAKLSGDRSLSKKEICKRVCSEVDRMTGSGTEIGDGLTKLKATLKTEQATRAPKVKTHEHITFTTRHQALNEGRLAAKESAYSFKYDDPASLMQSRKRWTAAKDELYQVMTCEIASPRAQRTAQIARLVGMALPLLQHEEYEFRKLALTIVEGRSYYLEVSDRSRRLKEVPNLMSIHLPSAYNPNSSAWKTDSEAVRQADEGLQSWLKIEILKPSTSFEGPADRCMPALTKLMRNKDEALATLLRADTRVAVIPKPTGDSLQGAQVLIRPKSNDLKDNGALELEWKLDGKEYKLESLNMPAGVLPLDPDDKRFIHFVPDGINIRDSNNQTLGITSIRTTTVSLSMMHKVLGKQAILKPFLALWERETGLQVDDQLYKPVETASGGTTLIYPASYFKGTGRLWGSFKAVKKERKAAIIKESKPVKPEDVTWLMHKFLLEHYPNIGDVVDAGNPASWPPPESDIIWPKLQTFLSGHKYRNHPQRANLISVAQNAIDPQSHVVSTLETILTLLRGPVKVDQLRSCKKGKDRIKKTYTIQAAAPSDLLAPNRPEPALVPYTTAQNIADQGLEPVIVDDSDEPEDDEAGPSEVQVTATPVESDDDDDDDEMLIKPDAPTSRTAAPPSLSLGVSYVTHTTGDKRDRSSSGEGQGTGKKARRDGEAAGEDTGEETGDSAGEAAGEAAGDESGKDIAENEEEEDDDDEEMDEGSDDEYVD